MKRSNACFVILPSKFFWNQYGKTSWIKYAELNSIFKSWHISYSLAHILLDLGDKLLTMSIKSSSNTHS